MCESGSGDRSDCLTKQNGEAWSGVQVFPGRSKLWKDKGRKAPLMRNGSYLSKSGVK